NVRLLVKSSDDRSEPIVEVAHDSVLTGWRRLNHWIKDIHGKLRLLRQMRLAAAEWEQQGASDDYLWSDNRLEPVQPIIDELGIDLTDTERRFMGLGDSDNMFEELANVATRHRRRA